MVDRVEAWGTCYPGYAPDAWDRVLGPHPQLSRTNGTPFECGACGCCWYLHENPDCGYVAVEQISDPEYRRLLVPPPPGRIPPDSPSRWVVAGGILVFLALLGALGGLTGVVAKLVAGRELTWSQDGWPGLVCVAVVAVSAWVLARIFR